LDDLSKATKLKEVAFWFNELDIPWITNTLHTITPGHRDLQKILIYAPYRTDKHIQRISREIHTQWKDLDCLLLQLWESHAVRIKVVYVGSKDGEGQQRLVTVLLPGVTGKKVIEPVVEAQLQNRQNLP
jgi:hypothetical protein